jgi:hypothetical protein
MKKTLIIIIPLALLTLGLMAVKQSRRLAAHQEQLAAARSEQEQTLREAEALKAANQQLEQEQTELREQLRDAAPRVPALPPAAGAATAPARAMAKAPPSAEPEKPGQNAGGMGQFLAKMIEDPDTRKFIRDQQRQMLDPLYAPLMKELRLTPEEAGQLKDFLADTQMKGAEKATSLFGGGTNRTELLAAAAAEQKSADEQIKGFLGEDRYAQFKDYQLTLGERMQLNQFKVQTADSEGALTDQQTEMLLTLMKEEKQNVAAAMGQPLPGAVPDAANMQAMLSGEQTDKLLQAQELANERVFERARSLLPENQLKFLGKFQTNQMQMMRLGMNMARKMFAPEGGTASPKE